MTKEIIHSDDAPKAIGTYSQAVKVDNVVYLSGQVPLDPKTMELVSDDIEDQIHQCFKNLTSVCKAAGGGLQDIVKLQIYLIDLGNFALVNEIMSQYISEPYPARAAIGVAALPKNSSVEMDGVMVLNG